jgi:hypothetical protein
MYYVKAQGKTLAELKKAVAAVLRELSHEVTVTGSSKVDMGNFMAAENLPESDDEFETVDSPYKNFEAPITAPTVPGEVDAENIPWDGRIHASSRALTKDGTWRTRRNLDDATYKTIKNELLANRGTVAQPVYTAPVYEAPAIVTPPLQVVQTPVIAPTIAMPVMNNGGHTVDSFKTNFAMIIATLITEGKITQDYINQLKDYFKTTEIWMLNDEQKAQVFESFVGYGFVKKVG